MPTLQMPELNFRNVRLIVYTIYTWISLVGAAAAQNSVHKAESSVGAKRDRLIAQGHLTYPTAQSIVVHLQVDDLHGISAAVMFAAGFVGIVYVVLQNGLILEKREREGKLWRWFAWIVRLVNSARGHLILLVCAVVLWVGTIVTTAMAIWIALNREQNVKMYVDGVKLSQAVVDTIERANKMPTRYWVHGYVRFMCIAPWPTVAFAIFPFILHIIAYRRLLQARTTVIAFPASGSIEEGRRGTSSITDVDDKASISTERIEMTEERGRVSL